jgi:hypothetical protein
MYFPGNLNFRFYFMKKITYLLLILSLGIQLIQAQLEQTGMAFLKLPYSARTAATESVFAQQGDSPLSLFENPIGIRSEQTMLSFSHHFWFANVSADALAISVPVKTANIGFGMNYVRIPGVEVRDTPSDEPDAQVEPQYLSCAAGYHQNILKKLDAGITIKYLYEHLYTYSSYGVAADLAARWQAPSQLDLSLALQNIGMLEADRNNNRLPTTLTIGIVRPELFVGSAFNSSLGLNLGTNLISGSTKAQIGAEIRYQNVLTLRGGFEQTKDVNRGAVGFGLRVGKLTLDYAFLFMPEGFNPPHIITLTYTPSSH